MSCLLGYVESMSVFGEICSVDFSCFLDMLGQCVVLARIC